MVHSNFVSWFKNFPIGPRVKRGTLMHRQAKLERSAFRIENNAQATLHLTIRNLSVFEKMLYSKHEKNIFRFFYETSGISHR